MARSANTIYDYARGDGWILTATDGRRETDRGHEYDLVLYYTDERRIETRQAEIRPGYRGIARYLSSFLDIGAELGPYPGASPTTDDYADQSRAVRMQRHAPDIYERLGHVRGMSPTIALRAAEEFGSRWRDKDDPNEWQRLGSVGSGRGHRFAAELR